MSNNEPVYSKEAVADVLKELTTAFRLQDSNNGNIRVDFQNIRDLESQEAQMRAILEAADTLRKAGYRCTPSYSFASKTDSGLYKAGAWRPWVHLWLNAQERVVTTGGSNSSLQAQRQEMKAMESKLSKLENLLEKLVSSKEAPAQASNSPAAEQKPDF